MRDAAGARLMPKLRGLFLCTGNFCRSQMAEGWARELKGEMLDAYSAETHPKALALARKNLHPYREHTGLDNVEFRLGEIEHLPVAVASPCRIWRCYSPFPLP